MSQDNLDVVRRALGAHHSGNLEARIEALLDFWDPGCEYTSVMAALEPATYHGHDGMRRYLSDLAARWAEWRTEPEEVIAAGDKVFTRSKLTGRHVGRFFGIPPTGNQLTWYTNERWRVEQGKMKERWAVDDLVSLFSQMGVPMPTWQ
jgi:predicted ester cyclase